MSLWSERLGLPATQEAQIGTRLVGEGRASRKGGGGASAFQDLSCQASVPSLLVQIMLHGPRAWLHPRHLALPNVVYF